MSDSNDGIPVKLLPPNTTPSAIGFMGTEILFRDLLPFVEKHLKDAWGDNWRTEVVNRSKKNDKHKHGSEIVNIVNGEIKWDLVRLLDAIIVYWTELINELRDTRNEIMHNDPFTRERADRALGTMIHLMQTINGGEDAVEELTTLRQSIGPPTPAVQLPEKKKDAEYYFNQGIVNFYENNYQEAIEDYDKAIELDHPNSAQAYNNRGNAKQRLGDHEGAIQDYDKAIGLNDDYAEAYNNRGAAKAELKEYQRAIEDFDKAIERNRDYAQAYNNRGNAKQRLGDHEGAIKDFDKAIELNLKDAEVYYNRGLAKSALEKYKEAIEDFDKAIELNRDYAQAYINRGKAKLDLEDYQGAIKDFEKAKELRKKK